MNKDLLRKTLAFVASLILIGLVAGAQYYAGWQFSLTILYFLPILIGVQHVGKWPGFVVAVLCGVASYLVNREFVEAYELNLVLYWNGAAHLAFFLIFALLLSSLESSLQRERRINKNLETLMTLSPADSRGWLAPGPAMPDSTPEIEQAPQEGLSQPGPGV